MGWDVSYKIEKPTKEECEQAIKQYLMEYNPCGYNTRVVNGPTLVNGVWIANLTRWNSCD